MLYIFNITKMINLAESYCKHYSFCTDTYKVCDWDACKWYVYKGSEITNVRQYQVRCNGYVLTGHMIKILWKTFGPIFFFEM